MNKDYSEILVEINIALWIIVVLLIIFGVKFLFFLS